MPTDAQIIVQRGAELIIDGGYITKSCEDLWQGIQVWGVGSASAHPTIADINYGSYPSSSSDHGVVYLKNGAIIEYAREGITTSKLDDHNNSFYWGGIVIAHDASFINCRRAIEFMQFDHSPSQTDDDNISEFMWCATGDAKIYDGFGELKYKHLSNTGHEPTCYTTGVVTKITPIDCGFSSPLDGYYACQSKLPPGGSGFKLDASDKETAANLMEKVNIYNEAIELVTEMAEEADAVQEYELEETSYSDDITYLVHERDLLLYKAVDLYLLENNADSSLILLNGINNDIATEMRVKIYLTQENYSSAYKEMAELNLDNVSSYDFYTLNEVLIGLYSQGKSINDINENQLDQMKTIAGKQSPSGIAAENIINYLTGDDSEEIFDLDQESEEKITFNSSLNINTYPNPTGDYLYVNCTYPLYKQFKLDIYNISGVLLDSYTIGSQELNILNVSQIASGLIFIRVTENFEIIFSEKIMIK